MVPFLTVYVLLLVLTELYFCVLRWLYSVQ